MRKPGFLTRAATYTIGTAATLFGLTGCGTNLIDTRPGVTTPDVTVVDPTDVNTNGTDVNTNGIDTNGIIEQPSIIETTAEEPLQFWKEDLEAGRSYTTGPLVVGRNQHFIDEPVGALILQPEELPRGYSESPVLASMECTAIEDNQKMQCTTTFYDNDKITMDRDADPVDLQFQLFAFRVNGASDQGLEGIASQAISSLAGPEAIRYFANVVVHPGHSPGYVPSEEERLRDIAELACQTFERPEGTDLAVWEVADYDTNGLIDVTSNGELGIRPLEPLWEGNAHDHVVSNNRYIISVAGKDLGDITMMTSSLGGYNPIDIECSHIHVLGENHANQVYTTTATGINADDQVVELQEVYRIRDFE